MNFFRNSKIQSNVLHAIRTKDVATLNAIVEKGAKAKARDYENRTLLHYCIEEDAHECIPVVLEKGVEIDSKDKDGWTPLHYAALHNRTEGASVLIERG